MSLKSKFTKCAAMAIVAVSLSSGAQASGDQSATRGAITNSQVQFDWLKKNSGKTGVRGLTVQQRKVIAAQAARFGKGSWVCSPAGSGKRSTCYSR